MNLTALRYKRLQDRNLQTPKLWKFTTGVGVARNIACLTTDPDSINEIAGALAFILEDSARQELAKHFVEVAVQFADSAGDMWVIVKTPKEMRFMRNNKPISDHEAHLAIESTLLDFDDDTESNSENESSSRREPKVLARISSLKFATKTKKPNFSLFPINQTSFSKDLVLQQVEQHPSLVDQFYEAIQKKLNDWSQELREPKLNDPAAFVKLARALRPLVGRFAELKEQVADAKLPPIGITSAEQSRLDQLKPELALIEHIEQVSAPIIDPAQTAQSLKNSLDKVEQELAETLAHLGLETPPNLSGLEDWRQPLDALTRMQSAHLLLRASESYSGIAKDRLDPLWREHIQALELSLTKDFELVTELETTVSSLQTKLRRMGDTQSENQQSSANASRTWFERLKTAQKLHNKKNLQDEKTLLALPSALDTARLALEFSAARMAHIRTQVEILGDECSQGLSSIEESHERLTEDYGRARDQWQKIANALGLPNDVTIQGLVKITEKRAAMMLLVHDRDQIKAKLKDRRQRLIQLEKLVTDWRTLTGSQKAGDLGSVQILIAEAKAVIRYKEEKRELQRKLQAAVDAPNPLSSLRGHLESRKTKLVTDWRRVFVEQGLTPLKVSDERIERLLLSAAEIESYQAVEREFASSSNAADILTEKMHVALEALVIPGAGLATGASEQLLTRLSAASSATSYLVITGDSILADQLFKKGCGRGVALAAPTPEISTPSSTAMPTTTKASAHAADSNRQNSATSSQKAPVVSDRARAALAVLNSPRSAR